MEEAVASIESPARVANRIYRFFGTNGLRGLQIIIVTRYDNTRMTPSEQKRSRGRPSTGEAMTAAERMRRLRARRRKAGLRAIVSWQPAVPSQPAPYSPHRLLEARSLAMHALIAAKIGRNTDLLRKPRQNLARWSARWEGRPPGWVVEWRAILERPWPEIAALITDSSDNAARLRQSAPFAGVLTREERKRVYEAFRA